MSENLPIEMNLREAAGYLGINRELGEFITALNKAIEDNGTIDPLECPEIIREGGDVVRVVGGLLAAIGGTQ